MFACKVLADSISRYEHRITTFEITLPRILLAELNTHRMLSRNSASSRAIPIWKSILEVQENPFVPSVFHKNQKGMSAETAVEEAQAEEAERLWRLGATQAVNVAEALDRIELHKGLGNRPLETYKWHTAIVTATEWSNFFALRCAPTAQPEFQTIANMIRKAYDSSTPKLLQTGEWHLPLITGDDTWNDLPYDDQGPEFWEYWKQVSVGRCARVSYLTHDGKRDPEADVTLARMLRGNGHLSPFEHVATPFASDDWHLVWDLQDQIPDGDPTDFMTYLRRQVEFHGNLHGFHSARHAIPNEHDFSLNA